MSEKLSHLIVWIWIPCHLACDSGDGHGDAETDPTTDSNTNTDTDTTTDSATDSETYTDTGVDTETIPEIKWSASTWQVGQVVPNLSWSRAYIDTEDRDFAPDTPANPFDPDAPDVPFDFDLIHWAGHQSIVYADTSPD